MKKTLLAFFTIFLVLVLTAGCNNGTDPTTSQTPKPPSVDFSSPGTQDTCSLAANLIVSSVDSNTTLLAIFATFAPTKSGEDFIWTIPGSLTVTVKATPQGNGSFAWEVRFNGTDGQTSFTNKLILSGVTNDADGTSGNMTAFSDTSDAAIGTFTWATTGDVVTGTLVERDSNQVEVYKIVISTNKVTSAGEVTTLYKSGSAWVQEFHATWTTQGGPATCS